LLWRSKGGGAEGPCCVGFVCGAVMLCKMASLKEIGFFDEDFFLYYEDEDICQRLFNLRREIILAPYIKVKHLSRSSTKREHFWRVEYGRGYHHAQSKILFAKKYRGKGVAIKLLVKVLGLALLSMFVLWLRPRYFARLVGRISGLIALWMRG
jgi:GT2 family glycosyltransferase